MFAAGAVLILLPGPIALAAEVALAVSGGTAVAGGVATRSVGAYKQINI